MEKPIKIYYESKRRLFNYGIFILGIIILMFITEFSRASVDALYISSLLKWNILFMSALALILYFYPHGVLELYKDHFTYKRGKFLLSAKWQDVNAIVFQVTRSSSGPGIPSAFFIDAKHGMTKLMETKLMRDDETREDVDLATFVRELESISGIPTKFGEISTRNYSKAGFVDYLKGSGVIRE